MKTTKRKKATKAEPQETLRDMLDGLEKGIDMTGLAVAVLAGELMHMESALQAFLVGEQPPEKPKRRRKTVRKPKAKAAKKARKPRAAKSIAKKPDGVK